MTDWPVATLSSPTEVCIFLCVLTEVCFSRLETAR